MDLDGDGIGDVLTGCYLGELYFFKGKGKGEFAAPVKLQRDGKDINLGASSTVFAADWRGTGRLDLLIGNMQGDLYLIPNDGTNAKPAYGMPRKLEAGGRPIKAPHHGDSQPIAADWDGDGLLDLLVAWGDGSVVWYRNVGSKTEPKLAKGVTLVKAAPWPNYDDNAPSTNDNKPGVRAKVCVVDWNGDGHLDLLVGDFGGIYGKKPTMSEQDKKIEQEANRKIQELQQKMQPFYDESSKKLKSPAKGDDSAEARRARQKQALEVLNQKEFQELQKEMQQVVESVRKFRRPKMHQGHVWLYLGKPPASAANLSGESSGNRKR
ncbi:MAG TPA: FG-GAP-like repeat-containing protein [Gemmataceae bacterium]|nr:FG-GAP-like repeat-containing protein [Gemmataceae bacterium]